MKSPQEIGHTLLTLAQCQSRGIRESTISNYLKVADRRILKLKNCDGGDRVFIVST